MKSGRGLLSILLLSMLLSGCGTSSGSSGPSENANIYTPDSYDITYNAVRKAQGYSSVMPSIGNIRLLVIPVNFTDYPCSTLDGGCDGVKSEINLAFFGTAADTGWESLASYYEKSSYGKLHITGTVTDWYTAETTAAALANDPADNPVSSKITQKALNWYKKTYSDSGTQFDSDTDGYIDAVWLVYSLEYNPVNPDMPADTSVFWAFTAYNYGSKSLTNPGVFAYAWASYKFMYEDGWYERDDEGYPIRDENGDYVFHNWVDNDGHILLDAHTYIHETGHLMGLSDYYTYDDVDWGAAGAIDMMDYNVGDHNSYSKSLYGWTTPKVVTGSTKVTLSPFEDSGDCLLLSPSYANTLCDEYLMIEFYTPTGLNLKDSQYAFAGRYPKPFSIPGIKVYHVDSRIGRFRETSNGYKFANYTTVLSAASSTSYVGIAHSNTASSSANPDYKLLQLMESSGQNSFKHGGIATDDTLFTEGDSFGYDTFVNYAFDNGTSLGYKFTVTSIGATGATLEITKI